VRVLLVNSAETMRGGESQTLELGLRLRSCGIETAFAVRNGSELAAALPAGSELLEARFERLPFATPLRLRRFISRWSPDLVHAQTSKAHTHALAACTGLVPLVVSRRTTFGGGRGPASTLKYGKGVAHYIPISEAAARSLRLRGVPDEKMTIVHSGIDIARFGSAVKDPDTRKRLGVEGEERLLAGTVAAFEEEKGHAVLLEAAAILESRGVRMRFVLAGRGRLEESIVSESSKRGLDMGIFRTGDDLPLESFLKALDIYVLSSLEEGLSTGLMAAMAAGLPCVASRAGGIPEVTGEDAALLFEPGDPKGLADALGNLAADRTAREEYSSRAVERVLQFDVERMVNGTIEVYRRVLSAARDGSG
jgi:glycosyltransferase involved in cell wall biosynthesis